MQLPVRLALALSLAPIALGAAEVNVDRAAVPAPVLAALQRQYPGATAVSFVKEEENGKLAFEARLRAGKALREVTFAADGTFLTEETQVAAEALPAEVKKGLAASKYARWRLRKAEQIAAGAARKLTWELAVQQGAQGAELVFDAEGKLVSDKSWTGKRAD